MIKYKNWRENNMTDLQECRRKIDEIDNQMVELFEKRMKVCEEVAEYKIRTGKKVLDPEREHAKLEEIRKKAHGEFNELGAQELFQQIMAISRKRQYQLLTEYGPKEEENFQMVEQLPRNNVTVVFQGVEGAYGYGAMRAYFQEDIKSYHVKLFRDAMEEVAAGRADYAVLPIENSSAGEVDAIYDLLEEYDNYIVGEQILKINHAILGLPGTKLSDIKTVYSHPQALMQCSVYLDSHPEWKQISLSNTAVAAEKVHKEQDKTQAAIASPAAAEFHGLEVLEMPINHNRFNSTRFIIVTNRKMYAADAKKVSICFELPHKSGSLYNILSHMIYNDLNMCKIESRPIPERNWEYHFFVDFEGNLNDSAVKNAIRGMMEEAVNFKILGNY